MPFDKPFGMPLVIPFAKPFAIPFTMPFSPDPSSWTVKGELRGGVITPVKMGEKEQKKTKKTALALYTLST